MKLIKLICKYLIKFNESLDNELKICVIFSIFKNDNFKIDILHRDKAVHKTRIWRLHYI
jgi:hypothetical protein